MKWFNYERTPMNSSDLMGVKIMTRVCLGAVLLAVCGVAGCQITESNADNQFETCINAGKNWVYNDDASDYDCKEDG